MHRRSKAMAAGVEVGDILLAVNGHPCHQWTIDQAMDAINNSAPGRDVTYTCSGRSLIGYEVKFCWRENLMKICDKTFVEKMLVVYRHDVEFLCSPPWAAFRKSAIHLSVRLSVPWRSCLGYRHAGCLQLSRRRSTEMCGRRSAAIVATVELSSAAGAYRLTAPGAIPCLCTTSCMLMLFKLRPHTKPIQV